MLVEADVARVARRACRRRSRGGARPGRRGTRRACRPGAARSARGWHGRARPPRRSGSRRRRWTSARPFLSRAMAPCAQRSGRAIRVRATARAWSGPGAGGLRRMSSASSKHATVMACAASVLRSQGVPVHLRAAMTDASLRCCWASRKLTCAAPASAAARSRAPTAPHAAARSERPSQVWPLASLAWW